MGDRRRRAAITIVLTLCGFALSALWLSIQWRHWSGDPWMRCGLEIGVLLWFLSDLVMWCHVWFDLHTALQEQPVAILVLRERVPVRSRRNLDV